jgi:hypothetical protein
MKPVIMPFWSVRDDGRVYQKRLTTERIRASELSEKARKAGKASALIRHNRRAAGVGGKLPGRSNDAATDVQPELNPLYLPLSPDIEAAASSSSSASPAAAVSTEAKAREQPQSHERATVLEKPQVAERTDAEVAGSIPGTPVSAAAFSRILDTLGNPPSLLNLGRVATWVRQGASIEYDVIPTLAAVYRRQRQRDPSWTPSTLSYFDQPIANAVAARSQPMPAATRANGAMPGRRKLSVAEKVSLAKEWGLSNATADVKQQRAIAEGYGDVWIREE